MVVSDIAARGAELDLYSLLNLADDMIRSLLIGFIRQSGVKFRSREAFEECGWPEGPTPRIANFWKIKAGAVVPSHDSLIWDLREPLLQDAALACCCVLLHRRAQRYGVRWIGGMETAAIPLVAGVLAVNRACGAAPLNGFYLRKKRKRDGLRRLLEGPPPPRGERVLLVDDILNKGISKRYLIEYCAHNGLIPAALLVVVDTERQGRDFLAPICPVEALFTRRDVLSGTVSATGKAAGIPARVFSAEEPAPESISTSSAMSREDVELVRLARDTVVFAALSGGQRQPTIVDDRRGSPGYSPFLGRYLSEPGVVFTRISKREFKDGRWFNRLRGCQAVGLLDTAPGTIADMTVKSALASATRARKVQAGPAAYHKPVWPEETGALSLFVYVVEQLVPTLAQTPEQLLEEGHDVRNWGLIAQCERFRGVICGDLATIPDIATQIASVRRKMQNSIEIVPQDAGKVTFIRMKGRWIWDPSRPKAEFF